MDAANVHSVNFYEKQAGFRENLDPWCRLISQQVERKSIRLYLSTSRVTAGVICDAAKRHPDSVEEPYCFLDKKEDGDSTTIRKFRSGNVQINGKTMPDYKDIHLNSGDELVFACEPCGGTYSYIFHRLQGEGANSAQTIENKSTSTDYLSGSVIPFKLNSWTSSNMLQRDALAEFPYLSDRTRYILVANAYLHTKTLQNQTSTEKLDPSKRAKILLTGPAGSEIFQERLCMVLASCFRSKCVVFDSVSDPVMTAIKPKTKRQIASKADSPSSVEDLKKPSFRIGDRVVYTGLNFGSSCAMFPSRGPTFGSRGKIVLYFGNSYKIGVEFDTAIDQGIDMGGDCEKGCGFFCCVNEVVLEPKEEDIEIPLSNIFYEAIEYERTKAPLFLFIKDIKKFLEDYSSLNSLQEDKDWKKVATTTESVIDKLSEHVIVIGSHLNTDENKKVVATPHLVVDMFPCQIAIDMQKDKEALKEQILHFEAETEENIATTNKKLLLNVAEQRGVTFEDIETVLFTNHVLTAKNTQNIVESALGYEVMHSTDVSSKSEIILSEDSISYGLSTISLRQTNFLKVLNDTEKKILQDSELNGKYGVKFDDIGAHDIVKDDLKTVVKHLLQGPELFSKGLTAKGCKGILLFGPPGTGKTMLGKAVATEAGANFISFSFSTGILYPELLSKFETYTRAVFSVAASRLSRCVIFVDQAENILGRKSSSTNEIFRKIRDIFVSNWDGLASNDNARVVVLLASNRPFDLDDAVIRRLCWRFMVNLPDASDRRKILELILAEENFCPAFDFGELVDMTSGYSGSDLQKFCESAASRLLIEFVEEVKSSKIHDVAKQSEIKEYDRAIAKRNAPASTKFRPLNRDDFRYAKEQISASTPRESVKTLLEWRDNLNLGKLQDNQMDNFEKKILEAVVMSNKVGVSFDDIGALDNVKDALKELAVLPLKRPGLFSKGQLRKTCKGILLFGPPGTGKTMLAKAVATEAGANLINLSLATVSSKLTEDSLQYAKAVFSVASKIAPCIIFIDQVDRMFGKSSTKNEAICSVKAELISNWDDLDINGKEGVLVIAASNRPFDLDNAIIARMPHRFLVKLPDASSRSEILIRILANENVSPDFNFDELAKMTPYFSGNDLKNLCRNAVYRPLREFIASENKEKETAPVEGDPIPVSDENYNARPLTMDDFRQAKKQVTASSPRESITTRLILEWNNVYGEVGSREIQILPYIL